MTKPSSIEDIAQEEFEETVNRYISWASEWDGALPADVFFGSWADLQRERRPLELRARVVGRQLELSAPPESSVRTMHNHIFLDDGRELVIQLEMAA